MRASWISLVAIAIATPAHADRATASIEVAIVACEHGAATRCIAAADDMERNEMSQHLRHTPHDLREIGFALLDDQCSAGNPQACLTYGKDLVEGDDSGITRGISRLERACGLGSGAACMYLGDQYSSGELIAKDNERALDMYDRACTSGEAHGCARLADRLTHEKASASHKGRISALYRKACAADDGLACEHSAADRIAVGDRTGALADLMRACEAKDMEACDKAGTLATDPGRARVLYLRACEADVASGCSHLADMVNQGKGGPRNWGKALTLAEKACGLDHDSACNHAGQIRAHAPDARCTTESDCQRLCHEKLDRACKQLAHLHEANFASLERECKTGDGTSCTTRGNAADTFADASAWYVRGCKAGEASSCLYAEYGRALAGSASERSSLKERCESEPEACVLYGLVEIDRSPHQAELSWRAACSHRQGVGCRLLAHELSPPPVAGQAPAVTADRMSEADRLLKRACTSGDSVACNELAYYNGTLTPRRESVPAWQ